MVIKSTKTKIGDWIVVAICLVLIILCLFPMLNVLATSLSSKTAINNRWVYLWPVEFTIESYTYTLKDWSIIWSLIYTAILTVISTVVSLLMTILCAYPLTQTNFVGRKVINTIVIFTMYFSAGIIPDYINIRNLNLLDTSAALIIPACLSVYNMVILKSFLKSVPPSLQESAELDGASHWVILFRIYLPLSTSVLATLALFYAVGRWNGFQDALYYISDSSKYPIQMKLYQIINNLSSVDTMVLEGGGAATQQPAESLKSATIMFATIPILIVYPWLQRYFITGVTVGAVKG